MKKRAAICFSGQPRNLESGFKFIKPNIIDSNKDEWDIDIFMHTWFDRDTFGHVYPLWCGGFAAGPIPNDLLEKIYNFYDPKKLLVEKQINFDTPGRQKFNQRKAGGCKVLVTFSKCYSIQKSIELKRKYEIENGFTYDLVESLRTDYVLKSPMKYNDLNLEHYNCSTAGVWNGIGVDVCHGIMNSKNADLYATISEHIERYWEEGTLFCDEHLYHKHLDEMQIPINRTPLLTDYDILRR